MLVTNAQVLGTDYVSELVDHGVRKKADTGDVGAVNKKTMKAFRHTPDVIAKVGNSYKKRFKVASRVEAFPKLLEETPKQRDAMKQSKRWDKNTDEWKDHIKSVAKTNFGGTDVEWKRWCSEILEPDTDRLGTTWSTSHNLRTLQRRAKCIGFVHHALIRACTYT